jgi:arylsulfatase A-like enzyme
VRVPRGGQLNTGVGVVRADAPVSFRVHVQPDRGEAVTLLDVTHSDPAHWAQHAVDLQPFAGQAVTLALETASSKQGSVALWGAPTITGTAAAARPNIIFYVIDGGSADQMSVYGYNRRTTPNLERLAQEGAVFEHAFSNSRWTQPSTASFMTSLQSSVLRSYWDDFEGLPEQAHTMAQRFHTAGYQTAVFVSNPWAGSFSNLERGVDVFRDQGVEPDARASEELQRDFWDWRDVYPGQPYWVHFQTTDVHRPRRPLPPFAGLFAPPQLVKQYGEWSAALGRWLQRHPIAWVDVLNTPPEAFSESGVDRVSFFDAERAIYDEALAHQDHELGRLVAQLKARGEWENTLLVIGGDHGIRHAGGHFDVTLQDTVPPAWQDVIFRAGMSHVPLLFIWPGHIAGGQRFSRPVSNIDILPTLLELAGLPQPEVLQGQSLAPLMLGRPWQPRPVILEIVSKDADTGALSGAIEVVDGRWAASLWIGPAGTPGTWSGRPVPLLLFDWQNDPNALHLTNDQRPDLVQHYTEFLEQQWSVHQLLAKRFTAAGTVELTAAQLETLRALGYIR